MRTSIFLFICEIICIIYTFIAIFLNILIGAFITFIGAGIYCFWSIYEDKKESKGDILNETKST